MSLRKRLIARLDIKGNMLIKGIRLEGLRVIGDPNEYAIKYYKQGADELVLMDAVASLYGRNNLIEVIKNRKVNDDNKSYTSSLFRKGLQECCKKFGEESVEVIIAALEKKESNLKEEVADLMYHLLVLLEVSDVDFDEVLQILKNRMNQSGLDEKSSRFKK